MYQHILVPLDGSELAECVIPHVKAISVGCAVVRVTLIRGVGPLHIRGGLETHISAEERERIERLATESAREYLEKVAAQLKSEGIPADVEIVHGDVVNTLIEYANKNGVDLIILATHGRGGISRWVWGSVTDRILRSSCTPVTMIRAPGCIPGI